MDKVGIVKEIWRYPVKGMAGERVEQCAISPNGLEGDRVWALRDIARQEIQSCKFRPELLMCTAVTRNGESGSHVDIILPDGVILGSNDVNIHQSLSDLVGYESSLVSLQPIDDIDFYRRYKADDHTWLEELKATFTREPDEPLPDFSDFSKEARDYVTVPGTFFLVTPFHIITTATLNYMQKLLPKSDWDIHRFRPNIVIETNSHDEGLVEQQWLGKSIKISNSHIDCVATAPRCGAITREQNNLKFDKSMLRTIVKETDQNLGIYGNISAQGILSVGDTVYMD